MCKILMFGVYSIVSNSEDMTGQPIKLSLATTDRSPSSPMPFATRIVPIFSTTPEPSNSGLPRSLQDMKFAFNPINCPTGLRNQSGTIFKALKVTISFGTSLTA